MNQLTAIKDEVRRPAPMSAEMAAGLDLLLANTHPDGEGTYSISEKQAPTPGQRIALCARRDELVLAIAPASKNRARAHLAAVMNAMPATPKGDESRAYLDTYGVALATLPGWAVEETCLAVLRGAVGQTGGRYMPAPGEMYLYADRRVAIFRQEIGRINRIIKARIEKPKLSEEQRKAASERVRRLMRTPTE